MAIEKDLLDQLLAGRDPKDVFNKDELVDELKGAFRTDSKHRDRRAS
jgi:putative transposase